MFIVVLIGITEKEEMQSLLYYNMGIPYLSWKALRVYMAVD